MPYPVLLSNIHTRLFRPTACPVVPGTTAKSDRKFHSEAQKQTDCLVSEQKLDTNVHSIAGGKKDGYPRLPASGQKRMRSQVSKD